MKKQFRLIIVLMKGILRMILKPLHLVLDTSYEKKNTVLVITLLSRFFSALFHEGK